MSATSSSPDATACFSPRLLPDGGAALIAAFGGGQISVDRLFIEREL